MPPWARLVSRYHPQQINEYFIGMGYKIGGYPEMAICNTQKTKHKMEDKLGAGACLSPMVTILKYPYRKKFTLT